MGEAPESRARALQFMLEYLKDRYSDQLTILRDVDTKIKQRLTICAAAVGLVTLGLPALAKPSASIPLSAATVIGVCAFGLSLFRTLWLALRVLEVKVGLPGMHAAAFEGAARFEDLDSVPVLQELVINYARAVENNWTLIGERNPAGSKLKYWGRCTVGVAFVSVALLGTMYVFSRPIAVASTQEKVAVAEKTSDLKTETTPQAQTQQPNASPESGKQPSLLAEPQHIELGESYDPKTQQRVVLTDAKIEKK